MTAIFGIASVRGRPADRIDLARMDAAMAPWGPDGGGLHVRDAVGLGCRLLHVTEEDAAEQQPRFEASLTLVCRARLDNRANLCRQLGLVDDTALPESAVVLAAYRRWGERCAEHLCGDWVFALWDAQQKRLFIARDATGETGLYWWSDGDAFAFSTGLKGLFALDRVPRRPDPVSIAGLLTTFHDARRLDATAYEGIRRLVPGHFLTLDARGPRVRRWWQPERLPTIELPDDESYYEAFRELYADAVAQRLRGRDGTVAATLSAGLDSGSVVTLAAKQLAQRGQRLRSYVHRPVNLTPDVEGRRLFDELPLARQTALHAGNVDAIPLQSGNTSVLDGLERALAIHDAPTFGASNQYWLLDILQTARADGARVLLIGQGGNSTVSYPGMGTLWPDLRRRRFGEVRSALLRADNGVWSATRLHLLRPLMQALQASGARLPRRDMFAESAINVRFARENRIAAMMLSARLVGAFHPRLRLNAGVRGFRLGTHRGGTGAAEWMAMGAAHGMSVRDPTRDQRLVEFCWRLPDRVFWANGEQRALIRRGLRGCLPNAVLENRRRGLQSADLVRRMHPLRVRSAAMLARLEKSPLAKAWLNLPWMRDVHDRIHGDPSRSPSMNDTALFIRGLGVGLFLSDHAMIPAGG